MKRVILFIFLAPTLFFGAAGPAPLKKNGHQLYILTNFNCNVELLCKTLTPKEQDETIIRLPSNEPGKRNALMFEEEETVAVSGIGVRPARNLPEEYTLESMDSSHPEYGTFIKPSFVIGKEALALIINEDYRVEGCLADGKVVFAHTIKCTLNKIGDPRETEPLFIALLPKQEELNKKK